MTVRNAASKLITAPGRGEAGVSLHPGYGLLSLAYMAVIYSLSLVPDVGSKDQDAVVGLAASLLHIPGYAGLTFCVRQALAEGDARLRRSVLSVLVFLAAAACAALDEWHQSFVPGRTASMGDFLLDIAGSGAMLLFLRIR
jgi:VanZ family protein